MFDTQIRSLSDVSLAFRSLGNVTKEFQVQEVGAALATQNLTKQQYAQMASTLSLNGETTKLSAAKVQEAAATAGVSQAQATGIVTTLGLDTATKSYAASATMAKVAALGLNIATGMLVGILISGLFVGISKVVEKIKEWIHQDETLAKTIKELNQETTDIQSELNKLNDELETTKERIDEIKSAEGFTITNADDLSTLQEQNELLEAQIALKERELELKNQETNEQIEKWYETKWQKDTRGERKIEERNGITSDYYTEKTEEQYFQEQLDRANELYARQQQLNNYKQSLNPSDISAMTKEQLLSLELSEQENKELEDIQKYLTDMTGELNQQVSGYTAVTDEQKQMLDYWNEIIIKAAKYSSYQMWKHDGSSDDLQEQAEDAQTLTESLKAASEDIDNFQSRIETVFDSVHSQSEMTSTDIIDLMQDVADWGINFDWSEFGVTGEKGVGDLSAALQTLGMLLLDQAKNKYPELSKQLTEIYEDASTAADEFGTLGNALQSLADHHQVLVDTENAIKDTGVISAEVCSAILSTYPQMESVVNDYLQGVATTSDVYNALSEAYQGDLDAYYECVLAKKQLDYDFYKQVYDNLPNWVQEYLLAYQKDFGNFKNLAEAKIKLQEQFLKLEEQSQLTDNWALDLRVDAVKEKEKIQEILGIIHDTELDVSGIEPPTFNSSDSSDSDKKDSEKEDSIKQIDWAAHSIDNLSHHMEYLNNVIDNSDSYKERDMYLKQLISSQKQYNEALTEQANLYKQRYLNAVREVPQYRKLIESGAVFEIDTFVNQDDLYEAITEAQDLYTSWRDINTAQQDASKSLKEYETQLDDNLIEYLASEIQLIQNSIDDIDSDIDVDTEFHVVGNDKEILNSWKKDKYKELLDLSANMQSLLESKLVDYQRRLQDVKPETDEYYELQNSISETKQAINDCVKSQREYNSAILSLPLTQYKKQLDLIDKHIDILNKSKDKYADYISAVTYSVDQEIQSITDSKKSLEEYYNSLIEPIQNQLDILQNTNDERERALALQQAYYNLAAAENDLSVKTYVDGQGFIYRPNENAIREAQNSLDSALYDKAVAELQRQITDYEDVRDALLEDYDTELNRLNDLKDSWSEIISQIESLAVINEFKLKFGDSALTRIVDGSDTSTIRNITEWVTAVQGELDSLDVEKENLEDVINTCELIVESYEDGSINVDTAMNKIDQVVAEHTETITALNQKHINSVIDLSNEYKNSIATFGDSEGELSEDTEDSNNKIRSAISIACLQIKNSYNNLSRFMSSFKTDMISNISDVGDAASEMANNVANSASSASNALSGVQISAPQPQEQSKSSSIGAAIGAGLATVIGFLFKHDGMESGLVSTDQSEANRDSVFKRIALDDLKANEVPAVLQVGEAVLTKQQQDNVVHNMIAGVDYGMSAVKSINKTSNINVNIPEIHLHEIQNVDSFANEVSKTFKTKLIQEVRK